MGEAVAILRLLACCRGHVGTVAAAWGEQGHYVDVTICRLTRRGFLAKRKTGSMRRGYYDLTAAGYAAIDHDDRFGWMELQETAEINSNELVHAAG